MITLHYIAYFEPTVHEHNYLLLLRLVAPFSKLAILRWCYRNAVTEYLAF